MTTFSEYTWAKDLLTRMGYPVDANNVTSILAWEYAEGGHFHNAAKYNPLNTTMDHGRYDSINGVGVAAYPSYETGMDETVETLKLGYYDDVRHNLARSASPATTVASIAKSPWGTWHGVSAHGALARARETVSHHPKLESGHHHEKHHHKKHHGKDKSAGSHKIVLDLQELDRLSRRYRAASDEVVHHRRAVADIAAALEPARAALPDPGLAAVIKATFDWLLEPGGGLDDDARAHDALAAYTGDIHRLAAEADTNHNGTWGRGEAMAFAAKHKGESGAALDAVLAALAGGTIMRRTATATPSEARGSSRQARVAKVLAVADKQQASEHNGDNRTKYGAWYGANGVPWCAEFVSYVYAKSGNALPAIQNSKGFAYVPYAIDYAREHHQLHASPQPGDVFLLKDGSHTGIVKTVGAHGSFTTVEGNHGDQVARLSRTDDGAYLFWRPIK